MVWPDWGACPVATVCTSYGHHAASGLRWSGFHRDEWPTGCNEPYRRILAERCEQPREASTVSTVILSRVDVVKELVGHGWCPSQGRGEEAGP